MIPFFLCSSKEERHSRVWTEFSKMDPEVEALLAPLRALVKEQGDKVYIG